MPTTQTVTADLFVRSLVPAGNGSRLEGTLSTLSELAAADQLQDFDVRVWGDKVLTNGPVAETDAAGSLLDTVDRLEAWAAEADASLVGFQERTVGSVVDESRPALSLPAMTLVEYRGSDVARVTPHERDGVVTTVEDHLELLGREVADATPDVLLTG